MTMTDETTTPKPRKTRRKPVKRAATTPKAADDLAGLTVTNCPTACNVDRCVISGRNVCAHPRKGGLQGSDMHNGAALERLNRAKKVLGKRLIDLRYE